VMSRVTGSAEVDAFGVIDMVALPRIG
jgi:hypothetical protein